MADLTFDGGSDNDLTNVLNWLPDRNVLPSFSNGDKAIFDADCIPTTTATGYISCTVLDTNGHTVMIQKGSEIYSIWNKAGSNFTLCYIDGIGGQYDDGFFGIETIDNMFFSNNQQGVNIDGGATIDHIVGYTHDGLGNDDAIIFGGGITVTNDIKIVNGTGGSLFRNCNVTVNGSIIITGDIDEFCNTAYAHVVGNITCENILNTFSNNGTIHVTGHIVAGDITNTFSDAATDDIEAGTYIQIGDCDTFNNGTITAGTYIQTGDLSSFNSGGTVTAGTTITVKNVTQDFSTGGIVTSTGGNILVIGTITNNFSTQTSVITAYGNITVIGTIGDCFADASTVESTNGDIIVYSHVTNWDYGLTDLTANHIFYYDGSVPEQFVNSALSILSANIDNSTTIINVVNGNNFPSNGFRILIDGEIILVELRIDNTFYNCTRNCETGSRGSASHNNGTRVKHIPTIESLKAFVAQNFPRDIIFGINGSFSVQTATPLINPVQIIKTSTVKFGVGIVLTPPITGSSVFAICKNVKTYASDSVVVKFVITDNTGIVTPYYAGDGTNCPGTTTANLSFVSGDYLTIYCTSVGVTPGSNVNFTLTIV